ncbi:MAG: hypothetical protein F6K65_07645 [Moorea sp. SIO3C2]|nr:hypothetical protein [Moorena sp. SIO3C2]
MIPVFIVEEHNEAFFIWHYAVMKKLMLASNNILLHVDEHSDFRSPRLNQSIDDLDRTNLTDLYHFTYNELNIENFIIPAIYQGLYQQFYWLQHPYPNLSTTPKSICISSSDSEGNCLISKTFQKNEVNAKTYFKWLIDPNYQLAQIQHLTVDDEFPDNQLVVLDIDLDYFSCNQEFKILQGNIEITEAQYQSFIQDRYHYLRVLLGSGVSTRVEDGKYYLVFKHNPYSSNVSQRQKKVSESEIVKRIKKLVGFLQHNNVKLQLVCLCRSRISGYTPDDQWKFIEDFLLQQLGEVYDINVMSIDEILAAQSLNQPLISSPD